MSDQRPPFRIVYHPAPAPDEAGRPRTPTPIRLPADAALAAAWLRRRLGLSSVAGAVRFTPEPLVMDAETRLAVTGETAAAPRPVAPPPAPGLLRGLLVEPEEEREMSAIETLAALGAPVQDPAAAARQAVDDPFGALLGESTAPRESEQAVEDPFKGLLG